MNKIFFILSIIICFSSLQNTFISSREVRQKRSHVVAFKRKPKQDQSLNPNNRFFHSFKIDPKAIEQVKPQITQQAFKKWRRKLQQKPWHSRKYLHHFRNKRKTKTPLKFLKKHIRDVSETMNERDLETLTNMDEFETQGYNIIPSRAEKAKETVDALQEIRVLSQKIERIVSNIPVMMTHNSSRENLVHKTVPFEIRQSQLKKYDPLLHMKAVSMLNTNIPKTEISRDVKQLLVTPDDFQLELFKILSLLSQNKETINGPESPTINKRQVNPLLDAALQMDIIDPNILKSILNITLHTMDKQQTLEFVANVLKNQTNFIGSLSKNVYLNQSAASERAAKNVVNIDDTDSNGGKYFLIILVIILCIIFLTFAIWHVFRDQRTIGGSRDCLGTAVINKPGSKKCNRNSRAFSNGTEFSLEEPTPCLKRVIRKSVVNEGPPAKKESPQEVFKRAGPEDYVSLEGFLKWTQNWRNSQGNIVPQEGSSPNPVNKYKSSEFKRHFNLNSEMSNDKMSDRRLSPEKRTGRTKPATFLTIDELPTIVDTHSYKGKVKDKFLRK